MTATAQGFPLKTDVEYPVQQRIPNKQMLNIEALFSSLLPANLTSRLARFCNK